MRAKHKMKSTEISNSQDIIDSRDVIARIEHLESERENALEAEIPQTAEEWDGSDEGQELAALKTLAEEAAGYAADWQHGEALIRDSYFEDYARETAEYIGAIPDDAQWPCNCIDWPRAARELQQDYTQVDFDGVAYWIR